MPSALDALMDEIAERMEARQKAARGVGGWVARQKDVVTSTPNTLGYTGPGGLFGVVGLERDVISTRIIPKGIAGMMPARGTIVMHPEFAYFTGFQGETGAQPNGVCDDPPTAGPGKSCIQTAHFGRYSHQSRAMDIDSVGAVINAGETLDLRLINDPLLGDTGAMTTPGSMVPGGINFRREALMRMLEVGNAFQLQLTRQVFQGNPSNATGGGGYDEFPGLDMLIGTGHVDAHTQVLCPSLDSDIKAFDFDKVDDDGGATIVNMMTYMLRFVRHTATRTNLMPVNWVWAMRPELFYELTAVWPCSYLTARCIFGASADQAQLVVNANDQVAMRDAMRQGEYLVIDGQRIGVVLDDAIHEDNESHGSVDPGCFASDIYLLPMTVMGGMASLYWEYLDYSQTALQAVADTPLLQNWYWSDGGRYLWHQKPPNNFCVQWVGKIQPRIILRTPHLAGRITDVQYCPLQHTRSSYPDESSYVDGGNTAARARGTLYADWQSPVVT